jgi:hypothetical protein
MKNILIIGLGNIGSRYLQGIKKYNKQINVFGLDPSTKSLNNAEKLWNEIISTGNNHKLNLIQNYSQIPNEIDLAIISTTANVRLKVIKELIEQFHIRAWILEKVLVQSPEDLNELEKNLLNVTSAWVNCGYRAMLMHQKLRSIISNQAPIEVYAGKGDWGLACNTVHFLDLMTWWSGETLLKIDTSNLDNTWVKSKRRGFWEISGTLKANYSNGSKLVLESCLDGELGNSPMKIKTIKGEWIVDDLLEGFAKGPSGVCLPIMEERVSDLSTNLVKSILENGQCDLPNVNDSVHIHRIFLTAMLDHWNKNSIKINNYVPIT